MTEVTHKRIIRSTAVVGICTALSRLLGLVRMVLIARFFGTSLFVSAFFVAFRIPNMFRRLFGEGALAASFVPVFTESIEKDGMEEANQLAGKVITMLTTVLLLILAASFILTNAWYRFFPIDAKTAAVLPLSRIMMPYMVFICLVGLCMGMLNSRHHYFVPAATPVLLNIIWIGILLVVCPMIPGDTEKQVTVMAWGVLGAGLIQLLVQLPAMLKCGIVPKLSFFWRDEKVMKVLMLMGPGVLGMGVFQINLAIGTFLAYSLADWSVAALQYAELIIYLPLGLFATALGTVLLPTFSQQMAQNRGKDMLKTLNMGTRCLMFVTIPAAVGLGVLAEPLIECVFQYGSFDRASTVYTARALWFHAPGLVVYSLYKVFVPVFYSCKDTKTPAVVGIMAVLLNLVLTLIFIATWPDGYEHAGIVFASALSFVFNCTVLGILINKKIGNPGWIAILNSVSKSLGLSLVMGVSVYFIHARLYDFLGRRMGVLAGRSASLLIAVLAGIAIYACMALLSSSRELKELKR